MPSETSRTPPGRVPKDFDDAEKSEFLRLRRSGLGVNAALLKMAVGSSRYRRTMRADPEFRRDAEAAADYLIEALVMLRYQAAVKGGDAGAQEFLISRHDRARQFAATMRERRRESAASAASHSGTHEQALERLDGIDDAPRERVAPSHEG